MISAEMIPVVVLKRMAVVYVIGPISGYEQPGEPAAPV